MNKVKAIICDIDETFCKTEFIFEEAAKLGLQGQALWDYFHANVDRCVVNNWCVDLIKQHAKFGYLIIFITARSEEIRTKTQTFLGEALGTYDFTLCMRKLGDLRPSCDVKADCLNGIKRAGFDVTFALDDDEANCKMFRESGITTLKVLS